MHLQVYAQDQISTLGIYLDFVHGRLFKQSCLIDNFWYAFGDRLILYTVFHQCIPLRKQSTNKDLVGLLPQKWTCYTHCGCIL